MQPMEVTLEKEKLTVIKKVRGLKSFSSRDSNPGPSRLRVKKGVQALPAFVAAAAFSRVT